MKDLFAAVRLFLVLTLLTGVAYPLLVTGIAQAAFPAAANGSMVDANGKPVGSRLIGQPFDDPKYLWGRPSATGPFPYNAAASSGSNLGPTNPALKEAIEGRVKALRNAGATGAVPTELVTASGSGLDPHLSPEAAEFQAARIAAARKVPLETVRAAIGANTEGRTLGLLGEPRVNVLLVNLALDRSASGGTAR